MVKRHEAAEQQKMVFTGTNLDLRI